MQFLLRLSRGMDTISEWIGRILIWALFSTVIISTVNAVIRKVFSIGSNAWLEVQWYMFAAMVFFGAPYVLKVNEHVRVDVIYSALPKRGRIWIDIIGSILFLLPFCAVLLYFTWPWFVDSWSIGEGSSSAGGLVRWPVKLMLPLGFALLALQGLSELIKRIAALTDSYRLEYDYETPLQ